MECWQLGVHKAMLSMSSGYPGELSPGCGIDSTRLEMSRRGQERSTTQAQDRLIFRPGTIGSVTLRLYVTTSRMQLVCVQVHKL